MAPQREDLEKVSPSMELQSVLASRFSNLWACFKKVDGQGGLSSIQVRYRVDDDDFMAVAKRLSPDDGAAQVIFASAESWTEAFQALNRAIQKGKWKVDKPWKAP